MIHLRRRNPLLRLTSASRRHISSNPMALRGTFMPRITPPEKMEIHLTEVEKDICELLDGCKKFLESEKGITTTCRVAGGWVRDKLLGSESHDMDVALSDMMGVAFAESLTEFAQSKGMEMGHFAKIEQNPDQSKHLETATLKIFGLDIDLVNLRSEEYAEGSRIPTGVAFGTPLEDALRRDITINALFYNVHSREVEDCTGKGLDDLRNGIIRTPLPPRETFLDDPLRVLRCIRFASRFSFEVLPEVKEAAKDRVVQRALVSKVARERVGVEVSKMIEGRDPLRSAQLICELQLFHSVFSVLPPEARSPIPEDFFSALPGDALAAASILHALISTEKSNLLKPHESLLTVAREDSSSRARLYLASLILPYRGFTYIDTKKKTQMVVASVIRESLKLGTQNHYLDGIPILYSSIAVLKDGLRKHEDQGLDRTTLGLLLRHKNVHSLVSGNHWSTSILFSLVTDLVPFYKVEEDTFDVDEATKIIKTYNSMVQRILELGLQHDVDSKPILSGKEVVIAFGVGKVGPWVGKVLEDVVQWQLGNPSLSKGDCIEWLQGRGVDHYLSSEEKTVLEQPVSKRPRKK